MTLESQTRCDDTRAAGKSAPNDYENLSHLGDSNRSSTSLTEQYLDSIGKQSRTVNSKPSLTAEEFYQAFNEAFPAISQDHSQMTKEDIERSKHNPLRLQSPLPAWMDPQGARREAMLQELSENFDDLKGLSRANFGLGSGIRREDVNLFHDLYRTRKQGGCSDQISGQERKLYQKTASEEIGGGLIGFVSGSILGAEAGARMRMKFLRGVSQSCEGEAGAAFLGRAVTAFPKMPVMLVGATVLSLTGLAIGNQIDKAAGSSNYDRDRERLNRLMSNIGGLDRQP